MAQGHPTQQSGRENQAGKEKKNGPKGNRICIFYPTFWLTLFLLGGVSWMKRDVRRFHYHRYIYAFPHNSPCYGLPSVDD